MKVSIIIPTRNRSEMLNRSIEQAYRQAYDDFEVIVSNNASSDCTSIVLTKLKLSFPRLKVIEHEELLSLSDHWDKVIVNSSSGELILVIPDDDVLTDSDYISKVVRLFKKYPTIGLVFANYQIVNRQFEVISKIQAKFNEFIPKEYLFAIYNKTLFAIKGIGVPHLTAVFLKKAYHEVGGFDLDCMCPDTYLWLKILLKFDAGFISDNVADYLIHDSNLSNTRNLNYRFLDTQITKSVLNFSKKINVYTDSMDDTFDRISLVFQYRLYSSIYMNIKNGKMLRESIAYLVKANPLEFVYLLLKSNRHD